MDIKGYLKKQRVLNGYLFTHVFSRVLMVTKWVYRTYTHLQIVTKIQYLYVYPFALVPIPITHLEVDTEYYPWFLYHSWEIKIIW